MPLDTVFKEPYMPPFTRLLPLFCMSMYSLLNSSPVLAGGLMLYEIGTDNTGLVNAGVAARAGAFDHC